MRLQRITYALILLIGLVVGLVYSKDLLVPFILAILIWFIIKTIRNLLKRIRFVERLPGWLLSSLASIVIFVILGLIVKMVTYNIQQLSMAMELYKVNADKIITDLTELTQLDIVGMAANFSSGYDYSLALSEIFNSLTGVFSSAFLIIIYTLFLLMEESMFRPKLRAIYAENERFRGIDGILEKLDKSISRYVTLKTLVSLMTGVLSYVVLLIIGIDAPLFWAFLIFILNFIPTIGSLVATLFPAVFALFQFGEFQPMLLILVLVGAVQVVVGNIVEPRIMGNSLNISSLVVILTLMFWGAVWGITGMILSVPITVMAIIVCAEIPSTRFIAIMLSKKGQIGPPPEQGH